MQRDPELARFIHRMYDVFANGEPEVAAEIVSNSPGVIGIGTDPFEWWVDDAVLAAFRAQVPEMHAAGMRFRAGDVVAYSEGTVGWIADQPTLLLPDGNEVPMRMTSVCHREGEGGDWKMVQFHLSIGIPNQEALGEELTT